MGRGVWTLDSKGIDNRLDWRRLYNETNIETNVNIRISNKERPHKEITMGKETYRLVCTPVDPAVVRLWAPHENYPTV